MLWEEILLEKNQIPDLSSKPPESKYNLKDMYFRKAFIEKPKISNEQQKFNKAKKKTVQDPEPQR